MEENVLTSFELLKILETRSSLRNVSPYLEMELTPVSGFVENLFGWNRGTTGVGEKLERKSTRCEITNFNEETKEGHI